MMQATADVMLGWERIVTIDGQERDFYVRQLWGLERLGRSRVDGSRGARGLRESLRLDTCESARALG